MCAYRIRYEANIDWVGPGAGPMEAVNAPYLPGGGATGQTAAFVSTTTPITGTFLAADVTTLTAAMAADLAAQLNAAATLAKIQAWATGNP